jgi:hypothetical protein
MSASRRIAELNTVAESLRDERGGGWLARRIAEGIVEELEASKPPTPLEAIAELIASSGLVGRHLEAALWRHFADLSRADVFAGVALAASLVEARITLAELEFRIAGAEMAEAA